MPFVPAPNVAMVEMRYTYQGQQVENTLYFEAQGTISVAIMNTLGANLAALYSSLVQANMPTSLSLREIYITDLTTETSPTVTFTGTLPLVGNDGQPAMPSSVTLTMSFRTNGRGRSSRGRNYLLGITENEVDNNFVSSTFYGPWESFYQGLLDLAEDETWTWVVLSRIQDGLPRAVGLAQPVTSFLVVDTVVDNQRRRLPGRGT